MKSTASVRLSQLRPPKIFKIPTPTMDNETQKLRRSHLRNNNRSSVNGSATRRARKKMGMERVVLNVTSSVTKKMATVREFSGGMVKKIQAQVDQETTAKMIIEIRNRGIEISIAKG